MTGIAALLIILAGASDAGPVVDAPTGTSSSSAEDAFATLDAEELEPLLGRRVTITRADDSTISGILLHVEPDMMRLRSGDDLVELDAADVRRVARLVKPASRIVDDEPPPRAKSPPRKPSRAVLRAQQDARDLRAEADDLNGAARTAFLAAAAGVVVGAALAVAGLFLPTPYGCWVIIGGCGSVAGGLASALFGIVQSNDAAMRRAEAERLDEWADDQMAY